MINMKWQQLVGSAYTHTYTHTRTHAHARAHAHTRTHAHTHTHIHTHKHTKTCTHTCKPPTHKYTQKKKHTFEFHTVSLGYRLATMSTCTHEMSTQFRLVRKSDEYTHTHTHARTHAHKLCILLHITTHGGDQT